MISPIARAARTLTVAAALDARAILVALPAAASWAGSGAFAPPTFAHFFRSFRHDVAGIIELVLLCNDKFARMSSEISCNDEIKKSSLDNGLLYLTPTPMPAKPTGPPAPGLHDIIATQLLD